MIQEPLVFPPPISAERRGELDRMLSRASRETRELLESLGQGGNPLASQHPHLDRVKHIGQLYLVAHRIRKAQCELAVGWYGYCRQCRAEIDIRLLSVLIFRQYCPNCERLIRLARQAAERYRRRGSRERRLPMFEQSG